jgi:hypothetical protein
MYLVLLSFFFYFHLHVYMAYIFKADARVDVPNVEVPAERLLLTIWLPKLLNCRRFGPGVLPLCLPKRGASVKGTSGPLLTFPVGCLPNELVCFNDGQRKSLPPNEKFTDAIAGALE